MTGDVIPNDVNAKNEIKKNKNDLILQKIFGAKTSASFPRREK